MLEARTKTANLLRLPDASYFTCDEACTLRLQTALAELLSGGESAPPGQVEPAAVSVVAIGAPGRMSLKDHPHIPLLLALRYTGQRQWEVDHRQNVKVVAVNLDSGAVFLDRPLVGRKARRYLTPKPSMSGPPPDAINARSTHTSVERYVLADMNLPWVRSRLALTAFDHDWVSNTVMVELEGDAQGASHPPGAPSAFLGRPVKGFDPARIAGSGAVFCVPSKVRGNAGATLGGMLDLPARKAVVSRTQAGDALVTVTFLLLKKDEVFPPHVSVTTPADVVQSGPGAERHVQAAFSFDLRQALSESAFSGAYQVYAIVGEMTYGPYVMTVTR